MSLQNNSQQQSSDPNGSIGSSYSGGFHRLEAKQSPPKGHRKSTDDANHGASGEANNGGSGSEKQIDSNSNNMVIVNSSAENSNHQ